MGDLIIGFIPSADRPKGEWIFKPKDAFELMITLPKCSICGFESADDVSQTGTHGKNFCPNRGAKIDGERKEE